ncbi:hypothetical protein BGZ60DRAFT_385418 [Tricladium varicosporioides]|nr:hypothetical protein BGZ60DRAFT_385418 [Hymenoscyphus varicosporioides]
MSHFNLPVSSATQATASRLYKSTRRLTRKRQRASSSSSSGDEDKTNIYNHDGGSAPGASTNPLSLTPDEIAQYRLAGLAIDEELPTSKGIREWPHRGLPREKEYFRPTSRSRPRKVQDSEDEDEAQEGAKIAGEVAEGTRVAQGSRLRMQHLGVLTAILQRSLLEGDIARAGKAWALLLRAEVGGKPIDIKSTGYWGIGAELLIREFNNGKWTRKFHHIDDVWDGDEVDEVPENDGKTQHGASNLEQRWGTRDGLEKVKAYYEWLVIQYHYKRQYHSYTSALDFYPAMFSCEIYGIQYDYQSSLQKIDATSSSTSDDDEVEDNDANSDSNPNFNTRSHISSCRYKRRRRAEKLWIKKDGIRRTALLAAENVADRIRQLTDGVAFSRSHELYRLQGMLAMYIGDLSVPEIPHSKHEGSDKDDESAEQRFLYRQRMSDHETGKRKREEEQIRAREMFEKLKECGGESVELEESALLCEDSRSPDNVYNFDT